MLAHWRYRVRQFGRAVGARPDAEQLAVLDHYLTATERRWFFANAPRDWRHHLRTLELLQADGGAVSPLLARAALLHDVGKGHIRLYERVLYVLLSAGAPRLLDRLARPHGPAPLAALHRIRHHAAAGADWLATTGADPRLIDLVRRHHDPPGADDELRRLIAADAEA